jgi:transposase
MGKILTPQERENLKSLHRKNRDGRARDRIKAVLAYDDGYIYSEIARILLIDDETVSRHIEDYLRESKLSPNNGGSSGKLSDSEKQELITHLSEVTYLYVKDICQYVLMKFGKKYSISGMTKWLHENNFSYKKPHGVSAKASAEKQQEFIEFYEDLKESSKGKEPIYFCDSAHPHYQTQLSYGWIPKGFRKSVPTTNSKKHVNIIGGVTLDNHRVTFHEASKVNEESICDFLWKLRKANSGKYFVHVIWDNAAYHHSNIVQSFADEIGIKLHYLPPYSPNLNPAERLWNLTHEYVRYNQYYESFDAFREAIVKFFKSIGRKKRILRNKITDNFQPLYKLNLAS